MAEKTFKMKTQWPNTTHINNSVSERDERSILTTKTMSHSLHSHFTHTYPSLEMTLLPFSLDLHLLLLLWLNNPPSLSQRDTFSLYTVMDAGEALSDDPNRPNSAADAAPAPTGARYKLLSPAKLPISRSPCVTISPGLSPTSFLESPVLLSNMKVSTQ